MKKFAKLCYDVVRVLIWPANLSIPLLLVAGADEYLMTSVYAALIYRLHNPNIASTYIYIENPTVHNSTDDESFFVGCVTHIFGVIFHCTGLIRALHFTTYTYPLPHAIVCAPSYGKQVSTVAEPSHCTQ